MSSVGLFGVRYLLVDQKRVKEFEVWVIYVFK